MALDMQRKRLDAARSKYMLLRRKMESEFATLDSLGSKVEELEALRKVGVCACECAQLAVGIRWVCSALWGCAVRKAGAKRARCGCALCKVWMRNARDYSCVRPNWRKLPCFVPCSVWLVCSARVARFCWYRHTREGGQCNMGSPGQPGP